MGVFDDFCNLFEFQELSFTNETSFMPFKICTYAVLFKAAYSYTFYQFHRLISNLFPQYIKAPANGPSEDLKVLSRKLVNCLLAIYDYYGFSEQVAVVLIVKHCLRSGTSL